MEKINVAELLKDCPKGMELDCTMYDNVTLIQVREDNIYPIKIETPDGSTVLTKYGGVSYNELSKCIIFPKGETNWEGFQCPFKDGDIVSTTDGNWVGITTGGKKGEFIPVYCVIMSDGNFEAYLDKKEQWVFSRLATEEEKAKLFDAIKGRGYKWNAETKTLEKLVKPKFKVGDIIRDIIGICKVKITKVNVKDEYYLYKSLNINGIGSITFNRQDDWELVPTKFDITTLVPFESRVLIRDNDLQKWSPAEWGYYDSDSQYCPYKLVGNAARYCIPYEGNEHLLGTTTDCDEYYKTW